MLRSGLEDDSDSRRLRARMGLGVVIMSGRMPAAINIASMVKETIGTPEEFPL